VSIDLYFWKSAFLADPEVVMDRLAMDDSSVVRPDPAVAEFRAELLARWPELEDMISTTDPSHFLIMQVPRRWDDDRTDEVIELARRLELCHYDPQTGEFLTPDGYRPALDEQTGQPVTFPWADPDAPPDETHIGPLPTWPIWDAKTSPRLKPTRLTVHGDEIVTLHRGEDLVTRRGAAVVTGGPGNLDVLQLTAVLRDEIAKATADYFESPLAEAQRHLAERLQGEADYRAYILVGDTASVPFQHYTSTAVDILLSSDPNYPVAVAYSGLDQYPDLIAMDHKRWKRR